MAVDSNEDPVQSGWRRKLMVLHFYREETRESSLSRFHA
jgi:hypothetical protein